MVYKHWVEISQDLVDEITEERIIRDVDFDMLEEAWLDWLEENINGN